MAWSSTAPVGSISVKANRTILQGNTTYIEQTMGNVAAGTAYATSQTDHFWNLGTNYSGHHRFIKSPAYVVAGNPADPGPSLGTSIDGILYLKTTNSRAEWFHRNSSGIYQATPSFKSGTISVTDSYQTVTSVPSNVYGEIFMWRNNTDGLRYVIQVGHFQSTATIVSCAAIRYVDSDGEEYTSLNFEGDNLNIQVAVDDASENHIWQYRVTYRAM